MDYYYAFNKRETNIVDKLNNLNNVKTFWDDVRRLTLRIYSDRSLRSWERLAEKRYEELKGK